MLLNMMIATQAQTPFVRRLDAETTIGANTNVRAFDRHSAATRHGATMATDPCAMGRTASGGLLARLAR